MVTSQRSSTNRLVTRPGLRERYWVTPKGGSGNSVEKSLRTPIGRRLRTSGAREPKSCISSKAQRLEAAVAVLATRLYARRRTTGTNEPLSVRHQQRGRRRRMPVLLPIPLCCRSRQRPIRHALPSRPLHPDLGRATRPRVHACFVQDRRAARVAPWGGSIWQSLPTRALLLARPSGGMSSVLQAPAPS